MPGPTEIWSMSSLKKKLIKIGAKVICRGRHIDFQIADVAIPRKLFAVILTAHLQTTAAT